MSKKDELEKLRAQIDHIDDKLLSLFEERMRTAKKIADYKKENKIEVVNKEREKEVVTRLSERVPQELAGYVQKLYKTLFELSRDYQNGLIFQKKYGLIGRNINYSFSKDIHGYFADYDYSIINLEPEQLEGFFDSKEYAGFNVTIPYKKDACQLCDSISPKAERIGCVNTVIACPDGTFRGDNTDYDGFLYLSKRAGVDFNGKKVLVFGNGATSSTVCTVVKDLGGIITVISRTGENNYSNLSNFFDAEIIINTTPVGTYPETANQITDLKKFPKCEAVLDVVYNPLKSRLVQQAESLGMRASGGLPMLVAQGKRACELFTGMPIDDSKTEQVIQRVWHQKQNIVLVGMPGCGKSTIADLLAKELGREVIDTDAEIVKKEGKPIPQIFAEFGEPYFRAKESLVISTVAKKSGIIIATGGGSVLSDTNRQNLGQNGYFVFLERDINSLSTKGRPLSKDIETLKTMYAERLPYYKSIADLVVSNDGKPETAADKISEVFK